MRTRFQKFERQSMNFPFRMEESTLEKLRNLATERRQSINSLLNEIVIDNLSKLEKKEPVA